MGKHIEAEEKRRKRKMDRRERRREKRRGREEEGGQRNGTTVIFTGGWRCHTVGKGNGGKVGGSRRRREKRVDGADRWRQARERGVVKQGHSFA